ncbi:K(+)-transporting ATPase subunit F [Catalinimonas locisalis]
MTLLLILTLLVFGYLFYAITQPEKF